MHPCATNALDRAGGEDLSLEVVEHLDVLEIGLDLRAIGGDLDG